MKQLLTEKVTFHYHDNPRILATLIKWRTSSDIHHVGIEFRGMWYQALLGDGVLAEPFNRTDAVSQESFSVTEKEGDRIQEILYNATGSGYDNRAIIGFLLNRKLQGGKTYFCSELANECLQVVMPSEQRSNKLISPDDIRNSLRYFNLGKKVGMTEARATLV